MIAKPDFCKSCPISHLTSGYVPPVIKGRHGLMLVGEAAGEAEQHKAQPFIGGAGQWLNNLLKCAKIDRDKCSIVNTIGCHPPDNIYPLDSKWSATSRDVAASAVAHCHKHHLLPAVKRADPFRIVTLGNHATTALTPRTGITTWRGSPLPLKFDLQSGPKVIPTLHPAQLMRQAKLFSVVVGDLKKSLTLPPERYNLWPTLEEVRAWKSKSFQFDFEWDREGNVTLCGLSDRYYSAIVVPFTGRYIDELQRIFEEAEELIGHNIIGQDLKYIDKFGWKIKADYHDTMLKQHLIQPDYPHDLGFVASVFTNKVFWKGRGGEQEDDEGNVVQDNVQWRTWDNPALQIPRKLGGYGGCSSAEEAYRLYNARDTDGEFQINVPISQQLKRYKQEDVYWNVSVPIAQICREMSEHGLRIDSSRLDEIIVGLDKDIAQLESQLPDGLRPYTIEVMKNTPAPAGTYKTKTKVCRGKKKNGTSHPDETLVYTSPSDLVCPTCGTIVNSGRMVEQKIIKTPATEVIVPYNSQTQLYDYAKNVGCKDVINKDTLRITTGKRARKIWKVDHPEFITLDVLKKKHTLRTNFAKDSLLNEPWMYFNLRPHGTGEGRLSSTGRRKGIDLNIQNQPEDFRIIYIPDSPGMGILNLDISQGESQLTTWLAEDWVRWERIQDPNYDEHCDLASRIFGRTITKKDKQFRDVGKKINHARNYGMGIKKQREYLLEEGHEFSEADIREFVAIWEELNPGTAKWQRATIETAQRQGYLENPFGRRRWFQSRDFASKSLAFLPASTLADMVLRMMIAHYPSNPRMYKAIQAMRLKSFVDLVEDWRLAIQVHDSLVLIGPDESHLEQARRTKAIMTQSWDELNGFSFRVDLKYSVKSWGECKGLTI